MEAARRLSSARRDDGGSRPPDGGTGEDACGRGPPRPCFAMTSSSRRALITGVTGQDGSYLAELLLAKGYEVCGIVQPGSGDGCLRESRALSEVRMLPADITDPDAVRAAARDVQPTECYHLAAQTFVPGHERNTVNTNVI